MFSRYLLSSVVRSLVINGNSCERRSDSTLPPTPADPHEADGDDARAPLQDTVGAMFGCALDAAIAGVERHATRTRQKP
jgi:hypothetical protein